MTTTGKPHNLVNWTDYMSAIPQVKFKGVGGNISFDSNRDRKNGYAREEMRY